MADAPKMPERSAVKAGSALRRRAIGGGGKRAFDPAQMTREELTRFCTALMVENTELRAYAEGKDAEVQAGFARAAANVAAYKQSQEKWKTDYAFYLTLTRQTIDRLIDDYHAGRVRKQVLEEVADAIAEVCTAHTNPADKPRGGVQSWLAKAKRIWDAVDRGTLLDPERMK
jgi:hypothetical protein